MAKTKRVDAKRAALSGDGALNPTPGRVRDTLFLDSGFFDPRDLVQVKYEMLRRVFADGWSVTRSASEFGFSRPSYYQAQSAFEQSGLAGLVPRKRGPHGAHKLTAEALAVIAEAKTADPSIGASALAQLLRERLGLSIHPRTIERGLARNARKPR